MGCAPPGSKTAAKVSLNNGTTYYIRVGSANGVGGNFTLGVALPPANDDFANAITIATTFTPFTDTKDVTGATVEAGDPAATCGGVAAFRSVWYKFVSLGNNTLLWIPPPPAMTRSFRFGRGQGWVHWRKQAGTDNIPADETSACTSINTIPGGIYYVRVTTKDGTLSNLTFHLSNVTVAGSAPIRNYWTIGTPTLTWNRVTGATGYDIQISQSSLFTTLVGTTISVPSDQLSVTTDPLEDGIYYWRVRAVEGATVTGWHMDSFTIDQP